jgi:large subunit ribosomal protein L21e
MPVSKGYRHKTRSRFRQRRPKTMAPFLHTYQVRDRVVIAIQPSQVKGMPHRRFQGLVGTVAEVRRRSLVIRVPVGDRTKTVIARLEHVRPHGQVAPPA